VAVKETTAADLQVVQAVVVVHLQVTLRVEQQHHLDKVTQVEHLQHQAAILYQQAAVEQVRQVVHQQAILHQLAQVELVYQLQYLAEQLLAQVKM
jgi:hypothetical protein